MSPGDPEELDPVWDGAVIKIDHWHFHQRLYERYGIILGPGGFSKIVKSIEGGRALRIERQPGTRTIYRVRITSHNEQVYVLSDGLRLITVLPPSDRLLKMTRRLLSAAKSPEGL